MILPKVGPAFHPPVAGTDEVLAGVAIVTAIALLFAGALAGIRSYAERS